MATDPLPEEVILTVFKEGLQTEVAQMEVFWARPSSFKRAVDVEWNTKLKVKSLRLNLVLERKPIGQCHTERSQLC